MEPVSVNGVAIAEAAIAAEMQNHPAPSQGEARENAVQALVVRELLLQEARRVGLAAEPRADAAGRREGPDEALIRGLVEQNVSVEAPAEGECRAFFEANREKIRSGDLFEARHILFAAEPADQGAYGEAVARAEAAIETLQSEPARFPQMATELSDCPSSAQGGHLGQIGRGQTVPEFETFLFSLEEGQLCPVPVKTRFGAHVLLLEHKVEGRPLPYEAVQGSIADYLSENRWRQALGAYVGELAGRAEITGVARRA